MPKINSRSFATGLTSAQRQELFIALNEGLSYAQAREKVYEWYQENTGALRAGFPVVTQVKPPSITAIGEWYRAAVADQRYAAAMASATAPAAGGPADYDEEMRRALGQARVLATKQDLSVSALTALDRNELARARLALERERLALDTRHQSCAALLDRAKVLVKSAPTEENTKKARVGFQLQVDLMLEGIEHMKYGDDYLTLSPEMLEKYTNPGLPPPSQILGMGPFTHDD